jgi:uncharacterized SAM-binding protein YcdF (DUF218 family)
MPLCRRSKVNLGRAGEAAEDSISDPLPALGRRKILRAVLVLTSLFAAWAAAAFLLDARGQQRPARDARYDAIVVLGCRVDPGGLPSLSLARRTRLAVELYERGHAPRLLFTGGRGRFPPSEAEAAAALAASLGVPPRAILLEDRSTSTEENARFAAEDLEASRILLVSDAYHLARAKRVFARHFDAEIDVAGSNGTPGVRARGAMREVLAFAAYGLLGRF